MHGLESIPLNLSGLIWMLIPVAVMVYAVYDLFVVRKDMEGGEKIIWTVIILFLNIIGAFIYLVYVHSSDYNYEKKKLDELKELTEIKEKGGLDEKEFLELKELIMEDIKEAQDRSSKIAKVGIVLIIIMLVFLVMAVLGFFLYSFV